VSEVVGVGNVGKIKMSFNFIFFIYNFIFNNEKLGSRNMLILKKVSEVFKNTMRRWYSLWGILFLLTLIWLSLGIYENWEKSYRQIAFLTIKEGIELAIFYIGIKIVLGLNSVVASIGESFKHIFLKREFFNTLSREELLHIAKDINKQDSSIVFHDIKKDKDALQNTIERWNNDNLEERKKYIIVESWSNETLYTNNQLIIHRKIKIRMMENGKFSSTYTYLPFDKQVKEKIEDDPYHTNIPGNRWEEKSFQYHLLGNKLIGLKCNISNVKKENDLYWVQFKFETEEIEKGQEFEFEFSLSDTIDISDQERMDSYFIYEFDKEKHAIRNISFQIETYNDTRDPKIRLEPRVYKDGKLMHHRNNCCESLFYKSWNWTIRNLEDEPSTISYKLINPGRNLSQCS
jgi:hypothetical protein